jgi:hypothetical protein
MMFDFERSVGRNDYADATNMCHMMADMAGIGNANKTGIKERKKYTAADLKARY